MRLSRLSITLVLSLILTACGVRSFGGPFGDGAVPDDGGVPTDGPPPDTHIQPHDYYGYVTFTHLQDRGSPYNAEHVSLTAAFYREHWDPFREPIWPVETLETPDGVVCDLAMVSGMDGPIPPDPPPELDGGEIYAWAGFDSDGQLETSFDGEHYLADYRSPGGTEPWPDWLADGAMALQMESTGSPPASPFYAEVFLAGMPEILSPPPGLDEPVTPGPDGNHRVSWIPVEADLLEVHLHFNMDWDDSYFRCYPPEGRTELRLPHVWLEQWSWGYGELMVFAVNEELVFDGDGIVILRSIRVRRQQLNIAVF